MKTAKTILVPTDFSKVAENAIDYACEIAMAMKARIVLIHVYRLPVATEETLMGVHELSAIENTFMTLLLQVKNRLHTTYGSSLQVECICKSGFTVDTTIQAYLNENKVNLVIMGMNKRNPKDEKLIGSHATALIKQANCPVMVLNRMVKFKSPANIILAYDYGHVPSKSKISILRELAEIFNSKVYILYIVKEKEKSPTLNQALSGNGLDTYFNALDISFNFIENEDTVEGINDFAASKNADMIVVIPHKHQILENILYPSNTKRLAFQSNVPILALKE